MLSELTTAKTQAKAFSYFAFAGNLGIFIGPLFGGCLAKPAVLMPSVFGGIRFFEENPYALPNFCTAAISVVAAVSCALFLEEVIASPNLDAFY
jgi:MFS family permease